MSDVVKTDITNTGVLLVTLNRPETLNSLDGEMGELLIGAVNRASSDDAVRVMVLTGAGRGFCSGASAGQLTGPRTAVPGRFQRMDRDSSGSVRFVEAAAACHVPIIGAINGAAAGGGCGIALCCDVRFMAESARIGTIFIKRGVAADYGLAYWLPRLVGAARAFELVYDGNTIDAQRALQLGLANRVYPDATLLAETMAYAETIAKGPPLAYTGVRRLLVDSLQKPMAEFVREEWAEQARLLATTDCIEGFRSFVERRPPVFTGE